MKGSDTPVRGSSRTTPAIMKNDWNPRIAVRPTAASCENSERARAVARMPAPTTSRKPTMTAVVPSSPSSSPIAAKMKSLYATGMS